MWRLTATVMARTLTVECWFSHKSCSTEMLKLAFGSRVFLLLCSWLCASLDTQNFSMVLKVVHSYGTHDTLNVICVVNARSPTFIGC
jgi:hypothetical protein